jgi:5-methylcytosine-specific restriction endonuclease McrA
MVLNACYSPLGETSIARAMTLVRTGRAEVLRDRGPMHSTSIIVCIPDIIRLFAYVAFSQRKVPLTKRAVIARDNATCQYCGTTNARMTLDHVVPQSRGGPNTWSNLVCACFRCNQVKNDLTLAQSGFKLKKIPKEPSFHQMLLQSGRGRNWRDLFAHGTFSLGDEVAAA